jgi:hypothetical protein
MGVLELLKGKKSDAVDITYGLMGIIKNALNEDGWSYEVDHGNKP